MNDEQVLHAIGIDDAYHVERVLARGAGGTTELVTIQGAGPFVRKKIPVELANQAVWSAIGPLNCARLPKVEASYSLPDQYVVVYDYVPGQTLEELVTARGSLDASEAASVAIDVCEAAAALHSCGVIHRDLSPRNVIVAADGAHLIDLGIARMRVEGATRDTAFLGTRGFASPEQYGFAQTDARSDVYAIGRLLGYMLTGVRPDEDAYEGLLASLAAQDSRLTSVVARACAFEPSARYQSAQQMADALRGTARVGDVAGATDVPGVAVGEKTGLSTRVKVLIAVGAVVVLSIVLFFASRAFTSGSLDDGATSTATTAVTTAPTATPTTTTTTSTTPSTPATTVSSVDELPLGIADSGWHVDSNGYVHYAFGLKNTSEDKAVELVTVKVVGYDKQGQPLFTRDSGASIVLPGRTSYFSGLESVGGQALDRVEFTLARSSATKVISMTDPIKLEVTSLKTTQSSYGTTAFLGTLSVSGTDQALASIPTYSRQVAVTLVLRDEAENIVYGDNTYLNDLVIGDNQAFQIDVSNLPAYATAEAYASPW